MDIYNEEEISIEVYIESEAYQTAIDIIKKWEEKGDVNQTLNLGGEFLTSLPPLPKNVKYLDCWNNELTSLPSLPPNLERLWCYRNKLQKLPKLPSSLQILWCAENSIYELPALPPSLIELNCCGNQLTSLPFLPSNLERLACMGNKISKISYLPHSLKNFHCCENNLTSLPFIPPSVEKFDCRAKPREVKINGMFNYIYGDGTPCLYYQFFLPSTKLEDYQEKYNPILQHMAAYRIQKWYRRRKMNYAAKYKDLLNYQIENLPNRGIYWKEFMEMTNDMENDGILM